MTYGISLAKVSSFRDVMCCFTCNKYKEIYQWPSYIISISVGFRNVGNLSTDSLGIISYHFSLLPIFNNMDFTAKYVCYFQHRFALYWCIKVTSTNVLTPKALPKKRFVEVPWQLYCGGLWAIAPSAVPYARHWFQRTPCSPHRVVWLQSVLGIFYAVGYRYCLVSLWWILTFRKYPLFDHVTPNMIPLTVDGLALTNVAALMPSDGKLSAYCPQIYE